jgi:hypothetical protein
MGFVQRLEYLAPRCQPHFTILHPRIKFTGKMARPMVEVPVSLGPAGVRLIAITAKDTAQFDAVLEQVEEYSQRLVANFDGPTAQICARLADSGTVAGRALTALSASHEQLDAVVNSTFCELEGVVTDIESLTGESEKLDTIQAELVLLSDLLRTVEETVKRGI